MIILCKDKTAYDALAAVFPTVTGVALGERDPYANGGYVVQHPFAEEDIAALEQQLSTQIAAGDIVLIADDVLPPDWVPVAEGV